MQKNTSFLSRGRGGSPLYLERKLHNQTIRETTHESTEYVSAIFIVKKPR